MPSAAAMHASKHGVQLRFTLQRCFAQIQHDGLANMVVTSVSSSKRPLCMTGHMQAGSCAVLRCVVYVAALCCAVLTSLLAWWPVAVHVDGGTDRPGGVAQAAQTVI
jgi:hypothetical protein